MPTKYDQTSAQDIERFGKRLLNKTLREQPGEVAIPANLLNQQIGARSRSAFGAILEKYYYGITPPNTSEPDFPEAKVELKSTPLKRLSDGQWAAKERLVLNIINYEKEAASADFEAGSFLRKNAQIMLVSFEHKNDGAVVDNPIRIAQLLNFKDLPDEDQLIIRQDWEHIVKRIRAGMAHELSEGETDYLAACTKASNSLDRRSQPFGPEAKPRAFSFKGGYMTVLMRQMLDKTAAEFEYEPVIKDVSVLEKKTLESEISSRFDSYIGKSYTEIAAELKLDTVAKDKFALIARRILGVSGRKIEEFEKAEITMKNVQLKSNGKPKEAISFPYFKFKEVVNENWEQYEDEDSMPSQFRGDLERRFFFVIWRCKDKCKKEEERILEKVFFWNMPVYDLNIVKNMWERTKQAVTESKTSAFPKESEHQIIHVRPHGRNKADTDILPDGSKFTKQCFWLNHDYISSIIGLEDVGN